MTFVIFVVLVLVSPLLCVYPSKLLFHRTPYPNEWSKSGLLSSVGNSRVNTMIVTPDPFLSPLRGRRVNTFEVRVRSNIKERGLVTVLGCGIRRRSKRGGRGKGMIR